MDNLDFALNAMLQESYINSDVLNNMAAEQRPIIDTLIINELFENLSKEAKTVLDICLDCPSEITRPNKNQITKFLRRQMGWKFTKIKKIFKELTNIARSI